MRTFKVLAILLTYPDVTWRAHLDELEEVLRAEAKRNKGVEGDLAPLFALFRRGSLLALQQMYVETFDQQQAHSLHLFEHIHGESRNRGPAMVDLLEEYRRHGLEVCVPELPDYLPLFLEYLSLLPEAEAQALLGETIDVLSTIGQRLKQVGSPYHGVFRVLERLAPRRSHPLVMSAMRDMDRAMQVIGPDRDGTEPVVAPIRGQPE